MDVLKKLLKDFFKRYFGRFPTMVNPLTTKKIGGFYFIFCQVLVLGPHRRVPRQAGPEVHLLPPRLVQ